ncbi:MAG: stalk domain-containing protein, partial [Anaerovorax sp.]
DGQQVTPKDVNGNVVEPFIMGGTTYLPVRAVADIFGKEVSWDSKNAIVQIGGQKNISYLDEMAVYDFTSSSGDDSKYESVSDKEVVIKPLREDFPLIWLFQRKVK